MKQRTIGVIVLTIVMLAALSIPQGFAKHSGGAPALPAALSPYTRANLRGVSSAAPTSPSSSPASCGDLGFGGKFGTVMFDRAGLIVRLQHASPNTQYSIWLGYKTSSSGCDGSWQELGRINTNGSGSGGYHQALPLAVGSQYQVVVRDATGNTIYATAFFSP
jgi:hypothetical protein